MQISFAQCEAVTKSLAQYCQLRVLHCFARCRLELIFADARDLLLRRKNFSVTRIRQNDTPYEYARSLAIPPKRVRAIFSMINRPTDPCIQHRDFVAGDLGSNQAVDTPFFFFFQEIRKQASQGPTTKSLVRKRNASHRAAYLIRHAFSMKKDKL